MSRLEETCAAAGASRRKMRALCTGRQGLSILVLRQELRVACVCSRHDALCDTGEGAAGLAEAAGLNPFQPWLPQAWLLGLHYVWCKPAAEQLIMCKAVAAVARCQRLPSSIHGLQQYNDHTSILHPPRSQASVACEGSNPLLSRHHLRTAGPSCPVRPATCFLG